MLAPNQGTIAEVEGTCEQSTAPGGLERRFDVPLVAGLALKEKQIQQNVRPLIAIHKWFARRPGTLFRGILLSEFCEEPLRKSFFSSNQLSKLRIADPFMGGGTPVVEANRLGIDIEGWDVNPMAYWIVRQSLSSLDLRRYKQRVQEISVELQERLGALYRTTCPTCLHLAEVKYFIWVKQATCRNCGQVETLYPGSLVAAAGRHPRNVMLCQGCEALYETSDPNSPCPHCSRPPQHESRLSGGHWRCSACSCTNRFPQPASGPPTHRMVAIEAFCKSCSGSQVGRTFKRPDSQDLRLASQASELLVGIDQRYIPAEAVPPGDETDRLLRWGYSSYRELFNDRQLLGLSALASIVAREEDPILLEALATNLSDLVRYQNLLCRYDTKALKSLDVFSIHGFPIGVVQCESNLLGIRKPTGNGLVGSGGFRNISEKYLRAKEFCDRPFETSYWGNAKQLKPTTGERIGTVGIKGQERKVTLRCASATEATILPETLDAVLTDPPYFANVQYAELMDFCYVWLRKLVADEAFKPVSTRNPQELTGNLTLGRDLAHFTEGLSETFRRFAHGLKTGAPFVFTYHHNKREAYDPITVALLDAKLVVTRAYPCPAEMGGSIHIQGTASSILDTVFVCRRTGTLRGADLVSSASGLQDVVRRDLLQLASAGLRPTRGDAKCLAYGHLSRLAAWNLRGDWNSDIPAPAKLATVSAYARSFGDWGVAVSKLADELELPHLQAGLVMEDLPRPEAMESDDISF